MNYDFIEEKHKKLIEIAEEYMTKIEDPEHNMDHIKDVLDYIKIIIGKLISNNENIDIDVCIIGAYWHDVGRIEKNEGHEELSSKILEHAMKELEYDNDFILKCSEAIKYHGFEMYPRTKEGLIIQDADKIAWFGKRRWTNCLSNKKRLDSIIEKIPKLRNEILHFECSRRIYDNEIVKILTMLYHEIYGKNILEELEKNNLILETASIDDLDKIIELYSERIKWFEDNGINQWSDYLVNHPKEEFIETINNKNYYILKDNNQIVAGFELSNRPSFWEENKNALYIYKIVTKVGYKDLGKYIFGICENLAKKDNKRFLRLECKSDNKKLNDIYEGYGFKFIRSGQDYYNYTLRERELI